MPSHDLMVGRKRKIRDNDNVDYCERYHNDRGDEYCDSDSQHSGHVDDGNGGKDYDCSHSDPDGNGDKVVHDCGDSKTMLECN